MTVISYLWQYTVWLILPEKTLLSPFNPYRTTQVDHKSYDFLSDQSATHGGVKVHFLRGSWKVENICLWFK